MATYQYLPLADDEIRLLTLSPRCSGPPRIRINSQKLSSTHRPQYEALSYVWGSKQSPRSVTVERFDHNEDSEHLSKTKTSGPGDSISSHPVRTSVASRFGSIFQHAAQRFRSKVSLSITANLAQALPYLQLEEEERVLWIDAICIDQENLTERGQQVGRMTDIYKMADRVVFWLGPADRHTKLAIETVNRLAAEVDVNLVTEDVSERSAGFLSRQIYDGMTTDSLISLFDRPWFERLWIWQEVNARPDNAVVLVGDCSIMWKTIRKFLVSHGSTSGATPMKLRTVLNQALKMSRGCHVNNLVGHLLSTAHCKCGDDRDRIFALLGMLEPWRRFLIEPDYSKPAADVFKQVVLQHLVVLQRLDVLRYCGLLHKSEGMPSWVPNWSKDAEYMPELGGASPHIPAEAKYDGKGTLSVSGVEFGVVDSIQAPGLFNMTSLEEIWPQFVSRFFSLLPAYEVEGELDRDMEAMMRALCGNNVVKRIPQSDPHDITHVRESMLRWRKYLAKERLEPGIYRPPPISAGDMSFQRAVQRLAVHYTLFRTTEGHLGLVPLLAARGDTVCVVLGCDTPLLLRHVSDGQWCIVGDCNVHDVADGSALLSSLPDNFQITARQSPRDGIYFMAFRNMQTNDIQIQDPRITEPLPAGWEVVKHEGDSYGQLFGNKEQNWRSWNDPRIFPDALRARGVQLRTINLV